MTKRRSDAGIKRGPRPPTYKQRQAARLAKPYHERLLLAAEEAEILADATTDISAEADGMTPQETLNAAIALTAHGLQVDPEHVAYTLARQSRAKH